MTISRTERVVSPLVWRQKSGFCISRKRDLCPLVLNSSTITIKYNQLNRPPFSHFYELNLRCSNVFRTGNILIGQWRCSAPFKPVATMKYSALFFPTQFPRHLNIHSQFFIRSNFTLGCLCFKRCSFRFMKQHC